MKKSGRLFVGLAYGNILLKKWDSKGKLTETYYYCKLDKEVIATQFDESVDHLHICK